MRNYLVAAISIAILASCSSSKNIHRDLNSAMNTNADSSSSSGIQSVEKYPLWINSSFYTASRTYNVLPLVNTTNIKPKETDKVNTSITKAESPRDAERRYKELSKLQRKEFRKAMRESMRRYVMPSTKKETKRRVDG